MSASALCGSVFCLAALALDAPCAQTRPLQDDVRDLRTPEEYDELLDVICPRDPNGTRYAFAMRIVPSFDSESQLVVRVHRDDSVNVEIMKVAGRSAWDTCPTGERATGYLAWPSWQ